jgi:DNA-binding response OmpR family regulator
MSTHFPTVPVELAQKYADTSANPPLPLVLVVDDEPIITETLSAILRGSGLAPLTAPDGVAALEIAQVIPPDMLITDLAMPRMNGFDLAIEVNRTIPDCEIILISGHSSAKELVEMNRPKGRQFLTLIKPIHPADLLGHVNECLSRRGWRGPARIASKSPSASEVFRGDAKLRPPASA